MPRKNSTKADNKKASEKGKKGGQSSRNNTNQQANANDDDLEYFEIEEFTLDDLPGSVKRGRK